MRFALFLLLVLPLHADLAQRVRAGLEGTYAYSVSDTGSMIPTFDHTYYLLAKNTPFKALKVNDIILFWALHEGEITLVCHRVWARSSGGSVVLTRGDNNKQVDPWMIRETDYVGRVVGWVKCDIVPEISTEPVRFVLDSGAQK